MIKIGDTVINKILCKHPGDTTDISIVRKSNKDETGTDLIFIGLNNYKTTFEDIIFYVNNISALGQKEYLTFKMPSNQQVVSCSVIRFRITNIPADSFTCTFTGRLSFNAAYAGMGDDINVSVRITKGAPDINPTVICSSAKHSISRTILATYSYPCDIYLYINPEDFKLYITMMSTISGGNNQPTTVVDTLLSPNDYNDIPLIAANLSNKYPICQFMFNKVLSTGDVYPTVNMEIGARNMAIGENPNYSLMSYDGNIEIQGQSEDGRVPVAVPES